tara:strand:- start:2120 stop:3850 length:1731 start_codon:yes stop_codon:yes gene_type:complete
MTNIKSIPLLAIVSLITACGGGGSGGTDVAGALITAGGTTGGGNSGNTTTPTVSLSASTYEIVAGDKTTLTWSSSDASSCTASGSWSGSKSLSGNESITLDSYGDFTFSIDCSGATASIDVSVSDEDAEGSCQNPHSAKIKQSYIGNYDLPIPQNSFGDDHIKSIGFKDYGVEWIYNNYKNRGESWVSDCTQEEYVKLMYRTTLRQLKEHGVETAWVYNFGYWQDHQAETWEINHSRKHVSDWQIEYIAETAQDLGMNMHYAWQFLALDDENNMLFPFDGMVYVDMSLLKRIIDSHEEHILWEADRLQSLGVTSMSADWSAMWVCFCGLEDEASSNERDELKNYYMERLASIISQIKGRFDGEVYVGEGIIWNDSRVFDQVDGVIGSLPNLISDDEVAGATVDLIEERVAEYVTALYDDWTCNTQQPCWEYTTYQLPKVIWNMFAQSHANFLSTGWVEDGFCTQGTYKDVYYDDCMQYSVPTDFSAQAIFIEGMLRAIDKQPWFETKGTTASAAYWLSDTLIPDENQYGSDCGLNFGSCGREGFPNISQSVRGKPAEKIIKAWYTGQYEQYNPEYE